MHFFCATFLSDSEFGSAWQTDSDSHVVTIIMMIVPRRSDARRAHRSARYCVAGRTRPTFTRTRELAAVPRRTAGASDARARVRDELKVGWAAESQRGGAEALVVV